MKLNRKYPSLIALLLLLTHGFSQAQNDDAAKKAKGAIIIVAVEGDVKVKKADKEDFLPKSDVAAGKTIFDGHTVITGEASKAVLLLSNGSITTVTPKSELTFAEFTQKPFEKSDTKMSELKGEPSNSTTKLKLGYGDMVFNVKKLNPGSSFEIDSPVGNAGIRGTDGQMSAHQDDNGNFSGGVNMLAGQVVYTDPSGTQQDVPAGQGTSVQTDATGQQVGETQTGEVPVETTQQMQETTNEAETSTGNITVSETADAVSEANQAAAQEESSSSSEESKEEKKEESSDEKSSEESTSTEESTPTEETSTSEKSSASQTSSTSSDDATQQNLENSDEVDIINETGEIKEVDSELAKAIQALALPTDLKSRLQDYPEDLQRKIVALKSSEAKFLLIMNTSEDVLNRFFNYQDTTRNNLLGMEQPSQALRIIEHPLTDNEIAQTLTFDLTTQGNLALEPTDRLQATLAMGFQESDLDELLGYTETLRADLVATGDAAFVKTLVGREYTQSTLASLVADTRTTADILVGQELTGSAIDLFYTYSQENRAKVVADIQPTQVKTLLGHNLDDSQASTVMSQTGSTRDSMIEEPTDRLVAILAYGLTNAEAEVLYKYSAELRQAFVELKSSEVKFLLIMNTSEDVLNRFFTLENQTKADLLAMEDSSHALRIIEHPLNDEEVKKTLSYDLSTQANLILEPTQRLKDTLAMGFQESDLDELLGYTETLRADLVATGDAAFVKTLVGREYTQSTLASLVADTRTTADILVGQELTGSAIDLFYTYSQENRAKVVADIQPTQVKTLLGHNLDDSQASTVMSQTGSTRDSMIEEPTDRLVAILAYGLTNAEAEVLYKYSAKLRQAFVDANDQALVKSLLSLNQPEEETATILASFIEKGEIVDQVDTDDKDPGKGDGTTGEDVVSDAIAALLEDCRANGNEQIVQILYEAGDGKIDETLLAIGRLGNDILTEVTVDGSLDSSRFFSAKDAVMNLFYEEVALLFETWVLPEDVDPEVALQNLGEIFAAKNLAINAGNYDLDNHFAEGQTEFFLTAANEISVSGDVNFTAAKKSVTSDLALSLGAGSHFSFTAGSKLTFLDGRLNLGSRETSEFVEVSMEAGGDISIASLESLVFQDSSLKARAGDSIHLEAAYDISVNGLQFSNQLKEVYMQAITVDLQNVFFPDGSMVYLQSQFGGIDGLYPTFPTGDPNNLLGNRQFGRVNFIENVGYAETIINNRQTFDLFKDKIHISPLGSSQQP